MIHLPVYRQNWTTRNPITIINWETFFVVLGVIHLSTYLKNYKVGDIVDIKVVMK